MRSKKVGAFAEVADVYPRKHYFPASFVGHAPGLVHEVGHLR